jgi:hypothetical protein
MSFALLFVRSSKKFNMHLCQKVSFVLAYFQASAAPRPENSDSDVKDALFGLDTQITVYFLDFNDFFLFCLLSETKQIFQTIAYCY